jgi:23S rRNA pseudouridine2604 synthase
MRINQYLAKNHNVTRRDGDVLVERGKVKINGKMAVLGQQVNPGDTVEVANVLKKIFLYYAYNKPYGEVIDRHPFQFKKLFPIGRLDKDSEGLVLLTNDGRLTERILNPELEHEKEYLVTVAEKLRPNTKEKMESGVDIEGYVTKKCKVNIIDDFNFKIVLTEGKKHQIRRMCAALFNQVRKLKRTRIMNITLDRLKPGEYRELKGEELHKLLELLNIE